MRQARGRGWTLLELMITLVVLGLLSSIALPAYRQQVARTRVSQAVVDIKHIEIAIERYVTARGNHPATLADLGGAVPVDPWGQPYRYLPMAGAKVGQVRKDHSLHPLNTDYDLYSMGEDGRTATPLTAKISRDDIVRARNGSFVGLASTY